ncbi:hypothetical protein BKA67DRAFT_534493 [Truncatella angustata]|uniref:Uncharacterized protein n=1 Tax=Truncatella angustata TaxID=152316 RepID=A0A9P8UNL2_9PEZI|nr:uncharacterized protein BKA67DRAFT_534493 [Truncatella angustata]KAH6655576.1 hypothetical protein BKA67DRAFT_534493 [Truncatella angustata]
MLKRWAPSPIMILLCAKPAITAPVSYFPINSQLPPVARISEPFSFVFSPLTFSSPHTISYFLVDSPEWLSLDSNNRRLYGTPSGQDIASGVVVGIPIAITAEDKDGSITVNSTLVVSRNPAPGIKIPLSDQIWTFGSYSAPSSIILEPSKDFYFSFDENTFSEDGLNYYAVSENNAPLPSWISFEADGILFSGRTPTFESLLQPPHSFDIQLVASDVTGFSSISVPFSIIVGNHELTADPVQVVLNAIQGTLFEYSGLSSILKIDDAPLKRTDVNSITTDKLPDWLQFDTATWEFSGTPGLTAKSINITVSITDVHFDNLNVTLYIGLETDIFRSELPTLNVSSGANILFDVKPYLQDPSDVQLQIENQSQAPWIQIDSSTLELLGIVPISINDFRIGIHITAKSKNSQKTDSGTLIIQVAAANLIPSLSRSSSTLPSTSALTPIGTNPPAANSNISNSSKRTVLLAVLIPLILLCVVVILLGLCCLRKRQQQREEEHIPEVSAPIPGSFIKHDTSSLEGGVHDMLDIGYASTRTRTNSGSFVPGAPSRLRNSFSTASLRNNNVPYAMNSDASGFRRSLSDSEVRETRESWLASRSLPRQIHAGQRTPQRTPPSRGSSEMERVDGTSLLSNVTTSTDEHHIHGAIPALVISAAGPQSFRHSLITPSVPGLSLPVPHEPFSIQTTPEFAYIAVGTDSADDANINTRSPASSDDSTSAGAAGLGIQRPQTSRSRTTSTRVSNAWKRASPTGLLEEYKRKSNMSSSTSQTTRTSILSSRAGNDLTIGRRSSRPTVIHIPSHTGEMRQISRRTDDSSTLFGGGSLVNSPKHFGLPVNLSVKLSMEPLFGPPRSFPLATKDDRDSDSSWKRITRDSLGIEYKDMIRSGRDSLKSMITARKSASPILTHCSDKENKNALNWNEGSSHNLMLPELWPKPQNTGSQIGPVTSRAATRFPVNASPPTPVTPGKNQRRNKPTDKRQSRALNGPPDRDGTVPSLSIPRRGETSHDGRSRTREQQALNDFKNKMSKPDPTWAHTTNRPLPKIPVQNPARAPLADLPNKSSGSAPGGSWSNVTRHKTNTSVTSIRVNKSEYAEMDDGWEDLRPESTPGAEFCGSSSGSLPAFI